MLASKFFLLDLAAVALAGSASAAMPFAVRYESEAPGIENTTAAFNVSGVETFSSIPTGHGEDFTTDFGTGGKITGTYSNVQINTADKYGGAGGTGKYPVAFSTNPYELQLSTSLRGGVDYFGYWLSALDAGNLVTFYSGATELFQFRPQDVINAVNATRTPGEYYGNPNSRFQGQDGGEPFIFLNFFDTAGSFNKIVFQESGGGGYESDNHTVGNVIVDQGDGASVPLTNSSKPPVRVPAVPGAVPEPAAWAMMLLGFGGAGAALRRRSVVWRAIAQS